MNKSVKIRFAAGNHLILQAMPNVNKLLDWYENNKRELPWRHTNDPYKIWLSEIILQQTRVEQGLAYYHEFIRKFPTIHHLAAASEDTILKAWQGLGYYSRARNLHQAAKTVVNEHDGKFPDTYHAIKKLKGVGPYTAAAVASIVFNEPMPVMDGNVMRVVSRWFAVREPVDSARGKKQIADALARLIDHSRPGQFNQAMMEFGAKWCKPKNPDCENCIFRNQCLAFQQGVVGELPRKSPKRAVRTRYFNYLVIGIKKQEKPFTILKKRIDNDIWKGLYEFPLVETDREISADSLMTHPLIRQIAGDNPVLIDAVSRLFIHQLTHQRIHTRFLKTKIQGFSWNLPDGCLEVPVSNIHDYPVSRLINKYLEESEL